MEAVAPRSAQSKQQKHAEGMTVEFCCRAGNTFAFYTDSLSEQNMTVCSFTSAQELFSADVTELCDSIMHKEKARIHAQELD